MTIGRFKIIDICIIVLLILCIIFGIRLGLKIKDINNEEYNTIVTEFAIELVKGNKSLEDIENLNIDDDIKETFREYYNSTFYNTSDTVVAFDSVSQLDKLYENIKEISNNSYIDGVFNKELFKNYLYENNLISISSTSEDEFEEIDTMNLEYFYDIYNPDSKSTIEYEIDGDNIIVKVSELKFNGDGYCIINYKGFNIMLVRDALDKGIRNEIRNSTQYISITQSSDTFVDNIRRKYYEDFLGNRYLITYEYSLGKIKKVIF